MEGVKDHSIVNNPLECQNGALLFGSEVKRNESRPIFITAVDTLKKNEIILEQFFSSYSRLDNSVPMCESRETFPSENMLKCQRMLAHASELVYNQCPLCFYCSNNLTRMKKHIAIHAGQNPYRCTVCGTEFITNNTFKIHQRTHTGKCPFKCSECGKEFAYKGYLQVHQRKHTGERPYQCPACEKQFKQKSNLQVHLRIHTDERPFKCSYCEKQFRQKSNLQVHQRTHL